MAEVFTISGARGFGAGVTALDMLIPGRASQRAITEAVAARAASSMVPTASPKAPPVARLQNALKALGTTKGDPTLSKVKVDGVVGPATTKAVNYAIAQRYVVMPSFPNPNLTVQHVRQFAGGIAGAIEEAVTAAGGTIPAVAPRSKRATAAEVAAATAASKEPPLAPSHSNTVWWIIGGAGLVLALGFAASAMRRRRREAEA